MMRRIKCLICNAFYKSEKGLMQHVVKTHQISSKVYYDKFVKKEGEGLCKECGSPSSYIDSTHGYRDFCSCTCKNLNKDIQEQVKQTCLKRFGVEFPSQAQEIKDKKKRTCFKHYGVDSPLQSKEIRKKAELTCIERFGENPLQSDQIRKKKKQTCFKNYGVEHPIQSEEIKKKFEQTCFKNYGTKNPFGSKEIQEKIKQGCLKNHGVDYMTQSELFKEKTKQTWLSRCGVEYATQTKEVRDKTKQTCLKKYGVENPSQSQEIYDKQIQTLLKKYGVCNAYGLAKVLKVSKPEKEIQALLTQHFISFVGSDRTTILNPKTGCYLELDLWFPDLKKAIEYNGVYWHSFPDMVKRDRFKKKQCIKLGIDLMIVDEYQYLENKNKVYMEILDFLNSST